MLTVRVYVGFVLILSMVLSIPADTYARDKPYRAQNDVLYFDDACSEGPTAKSMNTASSPTGAGCGEQGYANGTRNSQKNKEQIWSYLKGKGLSDEAAAGIMGNIDKESAFMPDAVNSIGCSGIVQWCYGRNDSMRAKAEAEGKDWRCLDYQLDYMWYEMTETSESQVMEPLKSSTSPGEAANTFHDIYERSNTATGEHLGRDTRAENIYKEFTGKDPIPLPDSSGSNSGKTNDNCPTPKAGKSGNSPIPSADCAELITKFNELVASGKIVLTAAERQENDLKNCSTGPHECNGGVTPEILRATVAVAENTDGSVTLWSHNTGHDCDGGNHPEGKAVDIVCDVNTEYEKCEKQFNYLKENAAELGINDIIWEPKDGQCMDSGNVVPCSPTFDGAGDHSDHIHVSTK